MKKKNIKSGFKKVGKKAYGITKVGTTFGAGIGSGMIMYGAINTLVPGSGIALGLGQMALSTGTGCAGFVFVDEFFKANEKAVHEAAKEMREERRKRRNKKHENHKKVEDEVVEN